MTGRVYCNRTCVGQQLVVTEGVVATWTATACRLVKSSIARRHHARLLVDDAHGIGVTGDEGGGTCWQRGVKPELLVATFGAFGVSGAAVLSARKASRIICCTARHLALQHQYAARPCAGVKRPLAGDP
ncbi:hypothetical protein KCP77_18300 [Salmonella enterica subsp. enterica]|nr:hypothetical protein KCP77_18300 [Salmonella enterica subsp. enterica]